MEPEVIIIAPKTLVADVQVGGATVLRSLSCNSYIASDKANPLDNPYYLPEFAKLFSELQPTAHDRILVHTGSNVVLASLLAAMRQLPDHMRPDLHLRILRPEPVDEAARAAHSQLADLIAAGKAFLYSETRAFANELVKYGHDGNLIDRLEVPVIPTRPCAAVTPSTELNVAVLGTLRSEKGYGRLASIAQCYRALTKDSPAPELKFLIHAAVVKNRKLADRMMGVLRKMEVAMDARLDVGDRTIHSQFLNQCQIVLLPYDPARYTNRGSSLACDAIASARPIVCQNNCTLEEYIRSGNGIATGTDLDFAAALLWIARRYETFAASSVALAHDFLHTLDDCSLLRRLNST